MKTEPKLSYCQLRQILSLTISNQTLKVKLEDFLSGKVTAVKKTACHLFKADYFSLVCPGELWCLLNENTGDKFEKNMYVPVITQMGSNVSLYSL